MTLSEALELDLLKTTRVVGGHPGMSRELKGVTVVDIPDPLPWVRPHQLLLTTGYAWPRKKREYFRLLEELNNLQVAGIGLAIPQFFDSFPEVPPELQSALDLPLLEIPWEVPFARISEAINEALLTEQRIVLERSEEIHREMIRVASEASSLEDIVESLSMLIGREVILEDAAGQIMARAGQGESTDRLSNSSEHSGSGPEILSAIKERVNLDIDRLSSPQSIPAIPAMEMPAHVVCPVRVRNQALGLIWIVQDHLPLNDLDMRVAESAATVVALHLTHQGHIAQQERRLGFSFIESLLEGRFEHSATYLERARLFGFNPDGSYQVGVVLVDESIPLTAEALLRRDRIAESVRQTVVELGLQPLITVALNRVVVILPHTADVEEILADLPERERTILLGRPGSGSHGVRTSYEEALSMAVHARRGEVHRYDDWIIPRVLMGDSDARKALHDRIFGAIGAQRNGDRLAESLVTWVEEGFNNSRTSQKLGVHRNTFNARLKRLEEALERDLDDPGARFELQLAVEIVGILHEK